MTCVQHVHVTCVHVVHVVPRTVSVSATRTPLMHHFLLLDLIARGVASPAAARAQEEEAS